MSRLSMWAVPGKLMELKLRAKFVLVQIESFQDTHHTAICRLWGCLAADHSRCRPLSTAESTNNERLNTTIRPQSNGSRCVEAMWGFVLQNLRSCPASTTSTRTTYPSTVAHMEMIFFDGHNSRIMCPKNNSGMVWRAQRCVWGGDSSSKIPRSHFIRASLGCAGQVRSKTLRSHHAT